MKQKSFTVEEKSLSTSFRSQLNIAFFAFILIGANDGAIGIVIPSISSHYHVDKAIVSLLFLCSSAGYLIAAFNSGLLVKKLGQRLFLLLGAGTIIIGAFSVSIVPPFVWLTVPFFLVGFGGATLDAGLNAYIAALPRGAERLNYLHAFYGAGALLGPLIVSTIFIIGLTWNYVYSLWMILGLCLCLGFALAFKKQEITSTLQPQEDKVQEKTSNMTQVLRLPVVWLAAFFLMSYVGVEVSLGTWSYSFLTEQRQQPPLFSAWTVSGYWMGLTLGRVILAKLVARLSERLAIQICVIGTVCGIVLVWSIPLGIISAIGLLLTGFCLGPIFPTTIALMPQFFSKRLLATAIGLIVSLGSLGGTFFPWLNGNLAQVFGLWIILPVTILLSIIMFIIWLLLQLRPVQQEV